MKNKKQILSIAASVLVSTLLVGGFVFAVTTIGTDIDLTGLITQAYTLSGSSALNAFATTVTDSSTISSGYNRGIYVSYTQSGAKTGTGEINPLAVDMGVNADVPKAFATSLYTAVTGNRTVDQLSALYYYGDALPAAAHSVNNWYALDIEMDYTTAADGNSSFMYVYTHGDAADLVDSVIRLGGKSTGVATYLVDFAANAMEPVAANTCSTQTVASDGSIKIRIGSTAYYIPYYTLANCD